MARIGALPRSTRFACRFRLIYDLLERDLRVSHKPLGDLPLLNEDDAAVGGTTQIFEYLAAHGFNLDSRLSEREQAESKAFVALVENKLYHCMVYNWWVDEENVDVIRPRYAKNFPFPLDFVIPKLRERRAAGLLSQLYNFRTFPNLASDEEVYRTAKECYQVLSRRLGTASYFYGEIPTLLDAVVFGHVATALYASLPNPELSALVRGFPNLVQFAERILISAFENAKAPELPPLTKTEGTGEAGGEAAAAAPKTKEQKEREKKFRRKALVTFGIVAAVIGVYIATTRRGMK